MHEPYRLYWGETHDNTHTVEPLPVPFAETLARAASHLDFYAAAYYTAHAEAFAEGGHPLERADLSVLPLEGWKLPERLEREWAEVQAATAAANRPGRFVTFPGYEWQGDGSGGDHNVVAREEGLPLFRVDTLPELYAALRGRDAIAIPHHPAYRAGRRGRDWSVYDEALSPFVEIYSLHGCSETDEEWIGLRQNSHMGPGFHAGTYQAALDRGCRLGAIASTDNMGPMPGHYGRGLMACLARELTREALWEAFLARRVYAVTGDRIRLDVRLDGACMGETVTASGPRRLAVEVEGLAALDRVEVLRGGRVIATHCHQGTWRLPPAGTESRWRLRLEAGWGPRPGEITVPPRTWTGELILAGGRVCGWEPCWRSPGQSAPELAGGRARFGLTTPQAIVGGAHQNALVFEIQGRPEDALTLRLNGRELQAPLAELAGGSRELWYRDECVALLEREAGIPPGSPEREDVYHFLAYKAKLHRLVPAAGYTARMEVEDDEPLAGPTEYRVRVEQRNGQRAWSSPIWVRPAAGAKP